MNNTFLLSLIRYLLAGLTASIVTMLTEHGFDPADAQEFGAAFAGFASALILVIWSWKKNEKISITIAEKDARIKKLETDPIDWNKPKDKFND